MIDKNNETSVDLPHDVIRDNLGAVAIQILSKKIDFANTEYSEILFQLCEIIKDLQVVYQHDVAGGLYNP